MAEDALSQLNQAQDALDAAQRATKTVVAVQPWSPEMVRYLSVSMLVFTLLVLLIAAVLLWRTSAPAQHILRIFGVIVIIGVSGVLLVVGYSNEQLTPIVGLFGAIAGYLLGKDVRPNDSTSAKNKKGDSE